MNNEKVGEITTDENGYGISDYLPSLGDFYLKELSPSKGYTIDTKNKYSFIVDKDNLLANVEVYERVIKADVTLFKTFASGATGILKGEPNITFEIYLNNCNSSSLLKKIVILV
ncbi:MAG: prealbumin-like fold domain-containing protein [Clostridium sp.]|nr:MAG: prealbumin-like fold domain-containing protein [Clostridium sp.]